MDRQRLLTVEVRIYHTECHFIYLHFGKHVRNRSHSSALLTYALGWGEGTIFHDNAPRQMDPYVFRCAEPSGSVGF